MAIADIHEDIIKTHILTRLDGQTLAAACCTSSQLQTLCSDHKLWSDICSSNWPSIADPLVSQAISNFPSGYRSFYSDSFPSPSHHLATATSSPPTTNIISSVDIKYHDELVFSKAESTNTTPSDWFQSSPFRIDLLGPKEIVPSAVKFAGEDQTLLLNLEKNMTLSWIMIDPSQNRGVNLSSVNPVSVHRNWLTGDVEVTFAVVIVPDFLLHNKDYVNCNIQITCGVKEVCGVLNVSRVSLTVLDMDSKCLSGKESMVILQGLTVAQRRRRRYSGGGEEQKERYDEFIRKRRERKENMERKERRVDMACVASGVAVFMAFWSFALSW
ncbi:F-box protein At2g27310 [Lactuca sativa]|uniref:F-box domain-containing protein n=1 Tax=Lactuca sativa TaxID=4236 RepID=A0A9R1WM77_LACSA|nr:F-box protein At2g27310 [Lactuca sativa]KAJ0227855.1 hypothetical protein LSAT_V11C100036300 [Lactuca sativa]